MESKMEKKLNYTYEVTGELRNGRRFKMTGLTRHYAMCINLWSGTVWKRNEKTGKRKMIKRV